MWVEVVGGRDAEIKGGRGFLPPKDGYRAYMLGIAWPSELHSGERRGSAYVGVDMWVEVVGGQNAEIEGGRGF
jgi:hypothetical protein